MCDILRYMSNSEEKISDHLLSIEIMTTSILTEVNKVRLLLGPIKKVSTKKLDEQRIIQETLLRREKLIAKQLKKS